MRAKAALGTLGIVAIGLVSGAGVFMLHRKAEDSSSAPSGFTSGEPSESSQRRDAAQPFGNSLAEGGDELLARADSDDGEAGSGANAEPGAPEGRAEETSPYVEALRHPSAGYRNVSLLAAIRGTGHICIDIISAAPSDEDLGVWRVSCDGARAYFVSEDGAGGLRVEPVAFGDAVGPLPVYEREPNLAPESPNGPLRFVPPQQ